MYTDIQQYRHTQPSGLLSMLWYVKRRKGERILVNKTQNKYAVGSYYFVFIYMLNLVIGTAEQKNDPYCVAGRSSFRRSGFLPYVDCKLCSVNDIVFDQRTAMPKLTAMKISIKCL